MSEQQPQEQGKKKTVPETAAAAELDEEAQKLAAGAKSPREFLDLLVARNKFAEAVRFIAHSLPRREAVWWAWSCARKTAEDPLPPQIKAALDAAEKWIAQPNDENARAAQQRAEEAKLETPAGCVAMAAFLGGGSLAPPNCPPVPPGEYMTAKAVGGGIILAAVAREPEKAEERYRAFISQGAEVAHRIGLWERPAN